MSRPFSGVCRERLLDRKTELGRRWNLSKSVSILYNHQGLSSFSEQSIQKNSCFCPSWSLHREFRKPFEPGKTESITACLECAAVAETADSGAQQNEGAALLHPNGVCLCGLDCQISEVSPHSRRNLAASFRTPGARDLCISHLPGCRPSGFGEYSESGAVRHCLSLSTGARTESGSSGWSTGQGAGAVARRVVTCGSSKDP